MSQWPHIILLFTLLLSIFHDSHELASTIKSVSPLRLATTSQKFENAASNEAVIYIDGKCRLFINKINLDLPIFTE